MHLARDVLLVNRRGLSGGSVYRGPRTLRKGAHGDLDQHQHDSTPADRLAARWHWAARGLTLLNRARSKPLMTSNFAIGNTATAAITPTPNAAPSVDFGTLNPAGTPIYGNRQLMAGVPRKLPSSLSNFMRDTHKILPPVSDKGTKQPAAFGQALVIPVSGRTSASGQPASISGKTLKVPGVPGFSGQISNELLVPLNNALTRPRVLAFNRLDEDQKTIARTLISEALRAMDKPESSPGRIDPKYMGLMVDQALWYARQPPTAPDRLAATPTTPQVQAAPTKTARTPTTTPVPAHGQSSPFDPRNEFEPTPVWTDEQVTEKVQELAKKKGLTAPQAHELMTDLLINPAQLTGQRVNASGKQLGNSAQTIRNVFGWTSETDLRTALAREIRMPLSALAARMGDKSDPALGQRVIDSINPASRERVAAALLKQDPGSKTELCLLRTLDQMFRSGDPKISDRELVKIYPDTTHAVFTASITALGKLVKRDNVGRTQINRLDMLRAMGFTELQTLSMSAVGRQLIKRFDPKLGTYSKAEQDRRSALNLPNTPEEAAARVWSAKYGTGKSIGYGELIVLGVLSDKPWLGVHDINNLLLGLDRKIPAMHGQNCVNHLFVASDKWRNPPIARGPAAKFHTPGYRLGSQIQLLQQYGLVATGITGKPQSIPTDYSIGDSPSPPSPRDQASKATRSPQGTTTGNAVDWREMLPLLEQKHPNRNPGTGTKP
jgi:hypothetical protein